MAANKLGKRLLKPHTPSRNRDPGQGVQKRQARVTVKYDRKELQKRLDVEKWIDDSMEQLYLGREVDMPDEVNIDNLLDLETDDERRSCLQIILKSCSNNTEIERKVVCPEDRQRNPVASFIRDLLLKLKGLPKQTLLRKNGLEGHPEDQIREHA
ncbi:protein phosphatase 1 regulatory subunit 14A isoform X1 [Ascaphus truei]|uniref:protein phosphatase 1 regulatory subunit 14A isoform X1 n=1 Tax=Ascaphus truei TaxID=8439 RepID=UPI003F5A62DF